MANLLKVMIGGGPASGKTTVMRALRRHFAPEEGEPSWDVIFVPEVATTLIEGNVRPPGEIPDPELLWPFQQSIWDLIIRMEDAFEHCGLAQGARLMICDRGRLDGAAYVHDHGGMQAFQRRVMRGETLLTHLQSYTLVIHLESIAVQHPGLYVQHAGNQGRYEQDPSIVAQLCERTRAVWEDHPDFHYIGYTGTLEEKTARVIELIEALLAK